jgi:hypothetical protein
MSLFIQPKPFIFIYFFTSDASCRKLSDLENVIIQLKKDILTLEQGKQEVI